MLFGAIGDSLPSVPTRFPGGKELGRKPHGWRTGRRPTLESLEGIHAAQKDTTATAGAKKSGNAAGVASPVARLSASKSNWVGGGGGLNLAR